MDPLGRSLINKVEAERRREINEIIMDGKKKKQKNNTSMRRQIVADKQRSQAEYRKFVSGIQNMSDSAFNQFMNNMEGRVAANARQQ